MLANDAVYMAIAVAERGSLVLPMPRLLLFISVGEMKNNVLDITSSTSSYLGQISRPEIQPIGS